MTSWQFGPSTRLSSVTTNDLFLYEVLKLFHRWPLTFRTIFLSWFVARDTTTTRLIWTLWLSWPMTVDRGQNFRFVVSLWRFIVSAHRYFLSTCCFPNSTRRISLYPLFLSCFVEPKSTLSVTKIWVVNQAVISALKSDAIWIQQLKDPSLPRYLFGLYKAYMKRNTRGAAKNDTSFGNLYCLSIEIFIHSFNSVAIFGVLMLATCGRFSWSLSRYESSLETRKRIATFLS